ncbi:MAG TPA: prolipoprotein diacylglyceryl transferase family protein, partial [Solirubrobacteraceae bacterium]
MKPEIHLIGISIKTFGVAFAFGFLACGLVIARRLRELDKPVDWAYEIVFAALIGGLVGARGYFIVQNYD